MFHVQYYIANGTEIDHLCSYDYPTVDDVDTIAEQYLKACPNSLPTSIFVSVRIYRSFCMQFSHMCINAPVASGPQALFVNTRAGLLKIVPMPMAFDAKLFILGTQEDADRYDLDRVFEATVLKDCERDG